MSTAGAVSFVPYVVWRDAEARLDLMEEEARVALRTGRFVGIASVREVEEPVNVVPSVIEVVPASRLILGPDGKPIGT